MLWIVKIKWDETIMKFIVFEGIDGCGKTTLIPLMKEYLESHGKSVVVVNDPSSTIPECVEIRKELLHGTKERTPLEELELYVKARKYLQDYICQCEDVDFVLCDRYLYSTLAYQGAGNGTGMVEIIEAHIRHNIQLTPDHVVYLQIDYPTSVARRKAQPADVIESRGEDYYKRVIGEFDFMANAYDHFRVIDARKPLHEVVEECKHFLSTFLIR